MMHENISKHGKNITTMLVVVADVPAESGGLQRQFDTKDSESAMTLTLDDLLRGHLKVTKVKIAHSG